MSNLQSVIHIPQTVLFRDLAGEAVLLHLDTGKYYGLDPVGARMWALLAQDGHMEQAYRALLDEYDVAPEQLERDLVAFVDKLAAQQLLTIHAA
jgi:hypothetical protein